MRIDRTEQRTTNKEQARNDCHCEPRRGEAIAFFSSRLLRRFAPRNDGFFPVVLCSLFVVLLFSAASIHAEEVLPSALKLPRNVRLLREVRVAVMEKATEIPLSFDAPYVIDTIQTGEHLGDGAAGPVAIMPVPNGLRIAGRDFKIYGVALSSPGRSIRVGKESYLDEVQIIRRSDGKLTAVNAVDLEAYLRGVLPKEIMANWPVEALKAQAVAARTYAMFDEYRKFDEDYSLVSTVQSQVYGGESAAKPSTNDAVYATRGEVLISQGKIIRAYFHASCGGHTYPAERVWPVEAHPALSGVRCTFCKGSPAYAWKADYSRDELRKKLNADGIKVGTVQNLIFLDQDANGRSENVLIRHDGGETTLNGNKFRAAVGAARLRSMTFDVEYTDSGFHFSGRGFGHGVGLCQWGMKRMAEEGKSYRDILAYYYPGAEVEKVYS